MIGCSCYTRDIKDRASLARNPSAHYTLLLWQKYEQIVDDTYRSGGKHDPDGDNHHYRRSFSSFNFRCDSTGLGGDRRDTSGKDAVKSSTTRVRALTVAVSFLARRLIVYKNSVF